MHSPLSEKLDQIESLCIRHGVAVLESFGSACKGNYIPGQSDLDFLVRFEPCTPEEHAERYFGLLADLQDMFQCDIDLVETKAIRNPFFLKSIEASRTILYAHPASDQRICPGIDLRVLR